jgi:MoxR-like ATPase
VSLSDYRQNQPDELQLAPVEDLRMNPPPVEVGMSEVAELRDLIVAEVSKAVVGHEHIVEMMTLAAIAGGHVLIEGPPGVAKTLVSNAVAHALGISYNRIQFTPDTTPTHISGETTYRMGEPVFIKGPVFTNLLLADEINRTPPRTQAALLEAMQERHVTVDGATHWLPTPFIVIATQNPYEHEGVFELPESQLDRFLFKLDMDYGDAEQEVTMLGLPHSGLSPDLLGEIQPLMGAMKLVHAQREVDNTAVPEDVARYVVSVIRRTRELETIELGASPRAAIHLLTAAKALARVEGRDTVTRSDVRSMAVYVLAHRVLVRDGESPKAVIEASLDAGD